VLQFDDSFGGQDVGNVMHRWFEQVEWLDAALPDDNALVAAVADLPVPANRLPGLIRDFRRACGRPQVAALLSRARYAGDAAGDGCKVEVWRERPFAVNAVTATGSPALVQGRIDRLVVIRRAGRAASAELIDYKTDTVAAADGSLARRAVHYTPQLQAYRDAVAQLLGLPPVRVAAKLAFVGSGDVWDVE
jgi:ATP-dependent exoDNAse (exonuclease V) beta subunit